MFPSLVGDIPDAKDRIARRPFFTVPRLGKDPVGVLRAQLKERERVRQRGASQTIQPQYGVAIGGLERGAGCYQGLLLSGHKTPTGRHQPEHLFWIALEEFHPTAQPLLLVEGPATYRGGQPGSAESRQPGHLRRRPSRRYRGDRERLRLIAAMRIVLLSRDDIAAVVHAVGELDLKCRVLDVELVAKIQL